MDGCSIVVISGIDGEFKDFESTVRPYMSNKTYTKLSYNRQISFMDNIRAFKSKITLDFPNSLQCILVGWSIGAVAVAFLTNLKSVRGVIMINAFFSRSEVLRKRNLKCEEEVCINNTTFSPEVKYIVIAGMRDSKIDYTNSIKIQQYYQLPEDNFILFENAEHGLSTFPKKSIAHIINTLCHE